MLAKFQIPQDELQQRENPLNGERGRGPRKRGYTHEGYACEGNGGMEGKNASDKADQQLAENHF